MIDFCATIYFKNHNAKMFGGQGSIGYSKIMLEHASNIEYLADAKKAKECINNLRHASAKMLGISVEDVEVISWEEYDANNGEDEDDENSGNVNIYIEKE